MATKQTWDLYHNPGVIKTNAELISMIFDLVETIHSLERIYGGERSQLLIRSLLMDYHALINMAFFRNLQGQHATL